MRKTITILFVVTIFSNCRNNIKNSKLNSKENMIEFVKNNAEINFDTIINSTSLVKQNPKTKEIIKFYGVEFYITSTNIKSIQNNINNSKNKNIEFNKDYSSETFKTFNITNDDKNSSLQIDFDLIKNQVAIYN